MGCVHSILKANKASNGINGLGQVNATCVQSDRNNESDLNVTKVTLSDLEQALEEDKGFPSLYERNMMESSGSESFDKLGSSSTIADFTKESEKGKEDIESKFPVDEKNKKTKVKKNKKESDDKPPKGKNAKFRKNLRDSIKKGLNVMALANLLAMSALDLTIPASDALIKTRKNAWVQLAGHPGAFAPAGPSTIWKKRLTIDNNEVKAYQALMEDPVKPVVPKFHREVEYNNEFFIEMEDLLHHFTDPNIMDIKMGVRTFLESEVKNPVLRKDLYDKMIKVDPRAPTSEEHEQKAITKLRYMQFREQESSTAELGFRIEAIRMSGEPPKTDLKKTRTQDQVACQIYTFLNGFEAVRAAVANRLVEIRDKFASSDFFRMHEIIGSSLLLMYDNVGNSGGWMIDFAKTLPLEDGMTKTHTKYWTVGSHEDGYVLGMDNLILVFQKLGDPDYVDSIQCMLRAENEELLNTVEVTIENEKSENFSHNNFASHENAFDGSVKFHPLAKSPEFGAIPEDSGHSRNTVIQSSANNDPVPENVESSKEVESSLRNDLLIDINSKTDSDIGNTDLPNDRALVDDYTGDIVNSVSIAGNDDDILGDIVLDMLDSGIEQQCVDSETISRTEAQRDRTKEVNTLGEISNSEYIPESELIDANYVGSNDRESVASSGTVEDATTSTGDNQPTKYIKKTQIHKTDSLVSDSLHSDHNSDISRDSQTSPT